MKIFKILSLALLAFVIGSCSSGVHQNVTRVSADEFQNILNERSVVLLDVRTPEEYAEGHIPGSHLANWKDKQGFNDYIAMFDKNQEILVYCRGGNRSLAAANYLAAEGYKVIDLEGGIMAWEEGGKPLIKKAKKLAQECEKQNILNDNIILMNGTSIDMYFVKHASLIFDIDGTVIYVDPVTIFGHDYSNMDKADAILVTHGHHDHYDSIAIDQIYDPNKTKFYSSTEVAQRSGKSKAVVPGDTIDLGNGITVTAFPAYNTTKDHLQFHPKERQDVGFIINANGHKIYVAGDTEVIDEMSLLANEIGTAFLPVNQPFTMTPEQAIEAIEIIQPQYVYPYHYGETDLSPIVERYDSIPSIDIRIRALE